MFRFLYNNINDILNIFEKENIFFDPEININKKEKLINIFNLSKEDLIEKNEILKYLEFLNKNNTKWIYEFNIENI